MRLLKETTIKEEKSISIAIKKLLKFTSKIFQHLGVCEEDADITADILVCADRRGIHSHGVARLPRYIEDIEQGRASTTYSPDIVHQTPISMVIDANRGMGHIAGYRSMEKAIEMADSSGIGMIAVRNSNHFGIAGYYSMMALEHDMVGFTICNTSPMVVPTYSRDALIGTNPISIAFPAKKHRAIVIDMATSTVPRGRLENYAREGKTIPTTWAVDTEGKPVSDPELVLKTLKERLGGGLLPLGGSEVINGGHKGYCLALAVEVMSGLMAGGPFSTNIGRSRDSNDISFFFSAMRIDRFRDADEFKDDIDYLIDTIKRADKVEGEDTIYIPGEIEFLNEERNSIMVEISPEIYTIVRNLGDRFGYEI